MKIKIPHLGYTVTVKKPLNPPEEFTSGKILAWVKSDGFDGCTLYIKTPVKVSDHATLAHEIVHILQFICLERNIEFKLEQEHMGYLMQYIFNEVTGYKYDIDKKN